MSTHDRTKAKSIGDRLRRLRLARGLSLEDLAIAMGGFVTKQALSKYELGKAYPTSRVLTLLAHTLSVKSAYLWGEPKYLIEPIGFRKSSKLSRSEEEHFKNLVCYVLEERLKIQEALQGPDSKCSLPSKQWRVNTFEQVEEAAENLRKLWKLGMAPINNVTDAMEDHCIHVIFVETPEGFDGISARARFQNGSVVGLAVAARKDVPGERMRFSLAHELGHLFLKPDSSLKEEEAAHRFGSAFLSPRETFFRIIGKTRGFIGIPELLILKRHFGMSLQALIHRLRDLKVITETEYKRWWPHLNHLGWRRHEPDELPVEEPHWLERNVYRALSEGVMPIDEAESALGKKITNDIPLPLLQKRNFMKLSLEERRNTFKKQAEKAIRHYKSSEW